MHLTCANPKVLQNVVKGLDRYSAATVQPQEHKRSSSQVGQVVPYAAATLLTHLTGANTYRSKSCECAATSIGLHEQSKPLTGAFQNVLNPHYAVTLQDGYNDCVMKITQQICASSLSCSGNGGTCGRPRIG